MPRIIVRIAKTGDTTVETQGFQGPSCKDVTRQLEKALGTSVATKDTEELYDTEVHIKNRV